MKKGEISNMVVYIMALVVVIIMTGSMAYTLERLDDIETSKITFGAQAGAGKIPISRAVITASVISPPLEEFAGGAP